MYLAFWNDADELIDRWIYLPVSEVRLQEILSGSVSVLEALSNPEDGNLVLVDVDVSGASVSQAISTTVECLPQESLPLEWSKLSIPFPVEISGVPFREGIYVLDMKIEGQVGRIPADLVGRLVGNLQRLLDAIAQAISATPSTRGPVPNRIREQTRLNLVGTYTSSLGLRFATEIEDRSNGGSLARSSLEGLFNLLEVDQQPREVDFAKSAISSRVASQYISLLSIIESSSHPTSLRWSKPGGKDINELTITPESARNRKGRIRSEISKVQDTLELEGVIVAGDVRKMRFQFTASNSRRNYYGRIHRGADDQLDHIPLGSLSRVILQPNLHINELSGEERTTYTLLSIRPM